MQISGKKTDKTRVEEGISLARLSVDPSPIPDLMHGSRLFMPESVDTDRLLPSDLLHAARVKNMYVRPENRLRSVYGSLRFLRVSLYESDFLLIN